MFILNPSSASFLISVCDLYIPIYKIKITLCLYAFTGYQTCVTILVRLTCYRRSTGDFVHSLLLPSTVCVVTASLEKCLSLASYSPFLWIG